MKQKRYAIGEEHTNIKGIQNWAVFSTNELVSASGKKLGFLQFYCNIWGDNVSIKNLDAMMIKILKKRQGLVGTAPKHKCIPKFRTFRRRGYFRLPNAVENFKQAEKVDRFV